jgi:hypothetical protein
MTFGQVMFILLDYHFITFLIFFFQSLLQNGSNFEK